MNTQYLSESSDLKSYFGDVSVSTSESSEVNMDESAGFDNLLNKGRNESRGSELMKSLHRVCIKYTFMLH